ncbi:MAG: cytidine/deoxycytidylate deaminase family protein [Candidatus Colwellbacteria bacterium]|nr:cytidine/deoxycytidylate deaminase family protein [Candidatus Colwellbacteria bacterium]
MPKREADSKHVRPSWDEYFLHLAEVVGTRATCDRGRAGTVVVRNKRILSTGYAGSPTGTAHCDDVGHEMHTVTNEDGTISRHCIRTTHSEQNAIVQAARVGTRLEGGTMYTHMTPCYTCAKIIVNAGIVRVVCAVDYHGGARSKELFREAGVEFILTSKKMEIYKDMGI